MGEYKIELPREVIRGGHASQEVLDIVRNTVRVEDLDQLRSGFDQDLENLINAVSNGKRSS